MPSYEFVTVDVFTDRRFGGNPLAVFPDARGLETADMQAIATEFNLSETTFVLPPANPMHTANVRIFTPRFELPFAGHPNVGTGYVLARRMEQPPEHLVFEEIAGLVRAHVLRGDDGAVNGAKISAPQSLSIGIAAPTEQVAACATLDASDIVTMAHDPLVASMGVSFIVAEVRDLAALGRAMPDAAAFRAMRTEEPDLPTGVLLYVRVDDDSTRLRTRMFAPLAGIPEDPATGSAAVTLAGLLTSLAPGDNLSLVFDILQGVEMGRPSRMTCMAQKTAEGPISATVGGECVPVLRGWLDL